ncbi:MAG: hypothetical protein SGJ19_19380 [Planctomycetia bacterium]|nr:hypothetical protein [Planctomycetia bacterium]
MVSKYSLALFALLAAFAPGAISPTTADAAVLRRAARLDAEACCDPCIDYRDRSCVPACERTVKTELCVYDCCSCCDIKIPVCLPCCCTGEPTVCCRNGLFGRQVVRYDWCCGCSVQVVILRCGDVVVTYL